MASITGSFQRGFALVIKLLAKAQDSFQAFARACQ
jgi:hypothetical protein